MVISLYQPAYHSSFTDFKGQVACGCAILPLVSKVKGPAPRQNDGEDIIEEVLRYFKANVLFRNYEIKTPADRVLIYLTLYVHQCLLRIERKKAEKKEEVDKILFGLAQESFKAPGDSDFVLGGYFASGNAQEKQLWTEYMKQAREETGQRLMTKIFDKSGKLDKFWMQFVKRKFLNKALEN